MHRGAPVLVIAALVAASLVGAPASALGAASPATAPVGSAPALPAGTTLQGSTAAGSPLHVLVALQPTDPEGLAALAAAVSTPGSPEYHHYLTTAQFAAQFGASQPTVDAVESGLAGLGLSGGAVSANQLSIAFTTTAGVAVSAFAAPIRDAVLPGGRHAYVNTGAPRVPAAIAPAIQAIEGLDDLPAAAPDYALPAPAGDQPDQPDQPAAAAPAATGPQACSAAAGAAASDSAYLPAQLASAYGMTSAYAASRLGAGQSVAIFELTSYNSADIATYETCFGASTSVTNVPVGGGASDNSGDVEAELDIEEVIGFAPQANIVVYEGQNSATGIYNTYTQIADDNSSKVATSSWTLCEPLVGSQLAGIEDSVFQQMATQGQTVFAASGDQGSDGCYGTDPTAPAQAVDDPASQPWVTGVGGTSLTNPASPPTEVVWNDGADASGGGLSTLWQQPSWQVGPGVTNTFSSGKNVREVPDVSASANPAHGYIFYYGGANYNGGDTGWLPIGGTSAAAPLWASLTTLGNQTCGAPLGFLNTGLYAFGESSGSFNDITSGNNEYKGNSTTDYPATHGYDLATGLGTPIASSASGGGLFEDWCPAPVFTADSPPATANAGTPYSYTFAASGTPAPTFSVGSGSLPPGLSLNTTSGVLSGTPTTGGVSHFTVAATGSGTTTTPALTITVSQSPSFTNDSPPSTAATGVAYTYAFTAAGYPPPTFAVASGSLPAGLTLSSAGLLSGTPTATVTVTSTFTVSASNGVGSPAISPTLGITVSSPVGPSFIADSPASPATAGKPYSYTFSASGNPVPAFSVASGSLPPGLALATSGALTGTPQSAGTFTFTVAAANGVGTATTPSLSILVNTAPVFTADTPPTATVAVAYSYPFTAGGSPAPTFAVATGTLPPGLSLNPASGQLSGTPTSPGSYTFTVSASNGVGSPVVTPSITLAVDQAPAFTADSPPPRGTVGQEYVYLFTAAGTPAPTFALASGSLPPGLVLVPSSGVLAGFPTTAGTYVFSVSASNGVGPAGATPALTVTIAEPSRTGKGYWEVASDGGLFSYGNAGFFGSAGALTLNKPIVGLAATPDAQGYWEVASDGGLFSYGNATFYGSMGGKPLNKPIVAMVATPDGHGYWEVASDGGLFAFGDAGFYGSIGGTPINQPIVGMVSTPDGHGYWEVASDGGLFSYGDATFYGSIGGKPINRPIVGMVATPDGQGYWEVASDGGLFSYGDAAFFGSIGGKPINRPIVGMLATPDGQGYWEVASDGGLFSYGDAGFFGSAGGMHINKPIVGIAGT